jgi:hypothetical protein
MGSCVGTCVVCVSEKAARVEIGIAHHPTLNVSFGPFFFFLPPRDFLCPPVVAPRHWVSFTWGPVGQTTPVKRKCRPNLGAPNWFSCSGAAGRVSSRAVCFSVLWGWHLDRHRSPAPTSIMILSCCITLSSIRHRAPARLLRRGNFSRPSTVEDSQEFLPMCTSARHSGRKRSDEEPGLPGQRVPGAKPLPAHENQVANGSVASGSVSVLLCISVARYPLQ